LERPIQWKIDDLRDRFFEDRNRMYELALGDISLRGNYAILLAAAEWIVRRLEDERDMEEPLERLNTCWAQLIHPFYSAFQDDFAGWEGPIGGPVRHAIALACQTAELLGQGTGFESTVARVLAMAAYVTPHPETFASWIETLLKRFALHARRTPLDRIGDPLVREMIGSTPWPVPHVLEKKVQNFVLEIKEDSRYAFDMDSMIGFGFPGKPYRFNLEEDRTFRMKRQTLYKSC
jgi:hypothetical protein